MRPRTPSGLRGCPATASRHCRSPRTAPRDRPYPCEDSHSRRHRRDFLHGEGPYLAWLSATFLEGLSGLFLRPLPIAFGRYRYSPRAAGLAAGAVVGLPGAPVGDLGDLVFPVVDSTGRSVGAGRRNRAPALPVSDSASARTPRLDESPALLAVCGPHSAGQPGRGRRRSRCLETTPKVPATVAAIPGLPIPVVDPCTPPATPPSPRASHPLHPMIAGHATGQKQGSDYRDRRPDRRPDRRRLRMSHSRPPGGGSENRSLALVPAAPKSPNLILSPARQDLAEAARP